MTTLTADQITDIRLVTGADATKEDGTPLLTDTQIQAQYDLATTNAPSSDLVDYYAYVYILRRLWGFQRTKADRETDHGAKESRSQIATATKEMLDYWEGIAGLSGTGILTAGVLALNLDTTEDDVE